mmetsp:Transcript_158285/g.288637  ORF Transcript_158285/g.288637 Transcript_158285/m.288637 type:complete len:207 (-) Transcript_158285:612-1232(-)
MLKRCNHDEVVMPLVTACKVGPACSRGTHCPNESQVNELAEFRSLPLIPAFSIHPLPQQFDRRLCTINLFGGHVQIIHENQAPLPKWRSICTFLALVELAIDDVLGLVGCCLRTECKRNIRELILVKVFQQFLLNNKSLTCAGQAREQSVVFQCNQSLQQESVSHSIRCGHHNCVWLGILRDVKSGNFLRPEFEFVAAGIWVELID